MHKFWVIFKREYSQVVKKKSFVVGIFLTPVLMAALILLPMLLADTGVSGNQKLAVIDRSEMNIGERFADRIAAYKLDDSTPRYEVTRIFTLAPENEEDYKRIYDSLAAAINDEELKYTVVVNPEPQASDTGVFVVSNSSNLTTLRQFEYRLSDILSSVRLEQSKINLGVDSVIALTRRLDLEVRDAKGESIPFLSKYFGGLIFVMIMFGMILGYGQMVMRNVIEEKNSRIMEVMMSSVSPFQLMFGKIMALGAATFTQVAIWVVIGGLLYGVRGTLAADTAIDRLIFNPVVVIFFVLYLLSGYVLFSTIFALLGSIVNSEKEAQHFVFPVTMSLILPVFFAVHMAQEPNSTISVVLSLIPLFTPTMMMMRVIFIAPTLTEYSLFSGIVAQAALGFILVCVAVIVAVWLTAKVFRVGILMYGKRPTLPEIVKWVRYR